MGGSSAEVKIGWGNAVAADRLSASKLDLEQSPV